MSDTRSAPMQRACSSAASTKARPAPRPRAAASTTTSSIQAHRPEGTSYHASESMPATSPPVSAQNRAADGDAAIRASASREGSGSAAESCGTRRRTASAIRSSIASTLKTVTIVTYKYKQKRAFVSENNYICRDSERDAPTLREDSRHEHPPL